MPYLRLGARGGAGTNSPVCVHEEKQCLSEKTKTKAGEKIEYGDLS